MIHESNLSFPILSRKSPVSRGTRTVWVVRASFEIRRLPTEPATGSFLRMQCNVGFREGQLTLVNIAEVSD